MRLNKHSQGFINHVAIIMDGNGRWAKKNKIPKVKGHKAGVDNCIKICTNLDKIGIKVNELSFYVFSTENWKRRPREISNLFNLIEQTYERFKETANENNLKVRHIGSRKKLSRKILYIIDDATETTKKNTGTCINLMFNYGSRQEIQDAIIKISNSKKKDIKLKNFLYAPKSKDPDLIIRTGGEQRLSNFMLWQSAYSEFYFTKTLWPDFNYLKLKYALKKYSERVRKYGK